MPDYNRSDHGSEFTAKTVRDWLERVGAKTRFIAPASRWENRYIESFYGKWRDELLDTLLEARALIKRWPVHYNTVRPHWSRGYQPQPPSD